jgi:asparagine synthase (glutamine-hydrolysing)
VCGITGIISFAGPVNRAELERANALIAHRGPDDEGYYVDPLERAGLAQRRLAIIDLSPAGHQPMVWSDGAGDVVIDFNGEIYNFRELRAECDAGSIRRYGRPIAWRGSSDTEVILWGYLLWGDDVLRLLDGMFALAIWDGRSGRLLLARDRFGVKPLYFARTRNALVFASELKALLAFDGMDRTIDPVAVAMYVTFLYSPGERTMFESVRKLPPGGTLAVDAAGTLTPGTYAPVFPVEAPDSSRTAEDAAEELARLLRAAVHRQMVADVPVGAFLSGGLDSSAVVNFAREHVRGGAMQCFTIGHKGAATDSEGWSDDLPYAKRVAAHLGVDLQTVWVGPEMARDFPWMIGQLDEPQADPAALNAHFICKLARSQGIKVLLSGAGGDDIFSGYRRHRALMFERRWAWLPQGVRMALRTAAQQGRHGTPRGRRLAKAFQFADASPAERMVGYFRWLPPETVNSILAPSLFERMRGTDPGQPMLEALRGLPPGAEPLARMLHLDSRFFLVDHNLNYTDKMSMAAGLEVRVPFLDPTLVAFASQLPQQFKQHGREGKWIFKKAMEPYLPADVIYRPKTGFGVPLRSWLQGQLRDYVDDTLSESTLRRRGLFDPAGVRNLLQLDRGGRIDATYSIFALMCVEVWCRRFVDGEGL